MAKKRFRKGDIFYKKRAPYDYAVPRYAYVMPVMDDNGIMVIVDCWVCDRDGNIHPGYSTSPVPISVDNFGHKIRH